MKLKSVALFTVLALSSLAFAETERLTYINTRGSELVLEFSSDNTLSGTFTTAVASKECQQAIGMQRPIVGYTAKNSIVFSVNYPDCGSVVTFIGNIENNKKIIDTTALIAHPT